MQTSNDDCKKLLKQKRIWMSLAFATWAILVVIVMWPQSPPPREAVATGDEFLERLKAGEYEAAYKMLSARKRKSLTLAELTSQWQKYEARRGFMIASKLESWQVFINSSDFAMEDQVLLDYSVRGGLQANGFTYMRLVPQKGWVIDEVKFELP